MDSVMKSDYYEELVKSKEDPELLNYQGTIEDIQTNCRELKFRSKKSPNEFVKCLQEQFFFEMLLGLLQDLLLDGDVDVYAVEKEAEMHEDNGHKKENDTKNGNSLEFPFYLEEKQSSSVISRAPIGKKNIPRTKQTVLGTKVLQLWRGIVEVCVSLNVSALYFEEIQKLCEQLPFRVMVVRWLSNANTDHIVGHADLCVALVELLVYLHNNPYFDATCFSKSDNSLVPPIKTCLASFFHGLAFVRNSDIVAKFSKCVLEVKFERYDQPLPGPQGDYEATMKPMVFHTYPYGSAYFDSVKSKNPNQSFAILPGTMRRLNQELTSMPENLPVHFASMIAVRVDEDCPQFLSALITAPPLTPYDSGCFLFNMVLPENYPQAPPAVRFMTTGNGKVRFSPNLYDCGKVCLSLLGTWSGDPWNQMTSTILQVLVSIQSAILGAEKPYYNEPGRERLWERNQALRDERIDPNGGYEPLRLATVEFAWEGMIRSPPLGFEMVVSEHFWLKRMYLLNTMNSWLTDGRVSDTHGYYTKLRTRMLSCIEALTTLVTQRATDMELFEFKNAVCAFERKFEQ